MRSCPVVHSKFDDNVLMQLLARITKPKTITDKKSVNCVAEPVVLEELPHLSGGPTSLDVHIKYDPNNHILSECPLRVFTKSDWQSNTANQNNDGGSIYPFIIGTRFFHDGAEWNKHILDGLDKSGIAVNPIKNIYFGLSAIQFDRNLIDQAQYDQGLGVQRPPPLKVGSVCFVIMLVVERRDFYFIRYRAHRDFTPLKPLEPLIHRDLTSIKVDGCHASKIRFFPLDPNCDVTNRAVLNAFGPQLTMRASVISNCKKLCNLLLITLDPKRLVLEQPHPLKQFIGALQNGVLSAETPRGREFRLLADSIGPEIHQDTDNQHLLLSFFVKKFSQIMGRHTIKGHSDAVNSAVHSNVALRRTVESVNKALTSKLRKRLERIRLFINSAPLDPQVKLYWNNFLSNLWEMVSFYGHEVVCIESAIDGLFTKHLNSIVPRAGGFSANYYPNWRDTQHADHGMLTSNYRIGTRRLNDLTSTSPLHFMSGVTIASSSLDGDGFEDMIMRELVTPGSTPLKKLVDTNGVLRKHSHGSSQRRDALRDEDVLSCPLAERPLRPRLPNSQVTDNSSSSNSNATGSSAAMSAADIPDNDHSQDRDDNNQVCLCIRIRYKCRYWQIISKCFSGSFFQFPSLEYIEYHSI